MKKMQDESTAADTEVDESILKKKKFNNDIRDIRSIK
jgi:hypothetical protein